MKYRNQFRLAPVYTVKLKNIGPVFIPSNSWTFHGVVPPYVERGERPTIFQIIAFGAAGGLVPCPAAVTVMLLAISVNRTGNGLLMVLGFSFGLAATLVAIGLAVVMGLNALGSKGRFAWLSRRAPVISGAVMVLSGAASLIVATFGSHAH